MAKRIYDEAQIRINTFLPPFIIEAMKEKAKQTGAPMAQVIREALIKHLEIDHGTPVHHPQDGR